MATFIVTLAVIAVMAIGIIALKVPSRYARRAESAVAAATALIYFVTYLAWATPLTNFCHQYAWQALVCAVVYGLLSAFIWLLDIRQTVGKK